MRWATTIEKDTFSERELKRSLRQTKIREEELNLLLCHLQHTGRMAVSELNIGPDKIRLLKLQKIGDKSSPSISDKEKAVFALE